MYFFAFQNNEFVMSAVKSLVLEVASNWQVKEFNEIENALFLLHSIGEAIPVSSIIAFLKGFGVWGWMNWSWRGATFSNYLYLIQVVSRKLFCNTQPKKWNAIWNAATSEQMFDTNPKSAKNIIFHHFIKDCCEQSSIQSAPCCEATVFREYRTLR